MKENNEFSEALNDYNIKKQSLTDQLNAFEALTKGIVESQNVFLYYFFSVGKVFYSIKIKLFLLNFILIQFIFNY